MHESEEKVFQKFQLIHILRLQVRPNYDYVLHYSMDNCVRLIFIDNFCPAVPYYS